jgi:molybdopterin adenylyltransferase
MIRIAVVTISDSAVAGTREDLSGPALEQRVRELGWTVVAKRLLPDEVMEIAKALVELADGGEVDVILTTGGTGLALRDVTPEATRAVANREVPGFGELMRAEGLKTTRMAPLSRGGAATRGSALIVNLPGSPRGALDSLNVVAGLVPHAVDLLHGRTQH